MRGYYQVSGVAGYVLWTWLLMIPVFGTIMWLEVTTFNTISAVIYLIFFGLVALIFGRQRVELTDDSIRFKPAFGIHSDRIPLEKLQYVQFTKRTVLFVYDGESYAYWLSPSIHAALQSKLAKIANTQKEDYDTRAINN